MKTLSVAALREQHELHLREVIQSDLIKKGMAEVFLNPAVAGRTALQEKIIQEYKDLGYKIERGYGTRYVYIYIPVGGSNE